MMFINHIRQPQALKALFIDCLSSILTGMPLSDMGLGIPGSGGGDGLAMNDTAPLLSISDILGIYNDIIAANQSSRKVFTSITVPGALRQLNSRVFSNPLPPPLLSRLSVTLP